jgi:protoporphyrinogen oxidase
MHVAIVGAGPAGLTAAYILSKNNIKVTLFEAHPNLVGGISRTEAYKNYLFDIGGHRFFSKSEEITNLWEEIMDGDFLLRPRKSSIYYKNKFYSYPLKAFEALKNLGVVEATRCVWSYVLIRLKPIKTPRSFEDWVSNQFGKRLYNIFFKTYTEKVWGISCKDISADWAAQRIKGLSLSSAILNALFPKKNKGKGAIIKTLIDAFKYPSQGPGMLWTICLNKCKALGAHIHFNTIINEYKKIDASNWQLSSAEKTFDGFSHVINTGPLQYLPKQLIGASQNSITAANELQYRDFLTVVLIVKDQELFNDNWIYIHDDTVQVGRIQNFKSWSPDMVPNKETTALGLEYFCFEGDGLWNSHNQTLIELASKEIVQLGLCPAKNILDGHVVRQEKAYPVYNETYKQAVQVIKEELTKFDGLQIAGRNGMHKYNNQDHSMMTAWLAAKNIMEGKINYNLWQVNEDADYHEEVNENEIKDGRLTPEKL